MDGEKQLLIPLTSQHLQHVTDHASSLKWREKNLKFPLNECCYANDLELINAQVDKETNR